ncbi:helix-hairpin-helix domain-containing protein [Shewanella sp. 1_MG-2023]|uniref:ComEA family DNA-binding protein n=1 Tax=unclassified Shewanella TaxID=196818 RepID=UPI0026E13873|nr:MULTISPECIES: helix-hairpin-helix domain-containing protein [unclassified Shewanella]MDO6612199.1 helix-hairpin-helix domain-containing protein [Shewanella sp. 7_MG-2023]MDO6772053.1 helix-hairpin-helix domain-containing protein [Shewanella sp. 2_MG-2023]MDO6795793.1 helix-hairpin-helix domain-containing protein [Shewanella sp. 1_MG-2023]
MKHPFLMGVMCACVLSIGISQPSFAKEATVAKQAQTQAKTTKVNINKANAAELQQLKGIGESKAKAIVDYRAKHGKFSNLEQLSQVSGVGDKLIEQNAKQISF